MRTLRYASLGIRAPETTPDLGRNGVIERISRSNTPLVSNVSLRADLVRAVQYTDAENLLMLMTIFVILLILWLLGVVTSYTMGGFIHILLVVAIIVMLVRI